MYIKFTDLRSGVDSDDFKRHHLLTATLREPGDRKYVAFMPGVYFFHPTIIQRFGLDPRDYDGARLCLAEGYEETLEAAQTFRQSWLQWREARMPKPASWEQIEMRLESGQTPAQILQHSTVSEAA